MLYSSTGFKEPNNAIARYLEKMKSKIKLHSIRKSPPNPTSEKTMMLLELSALDSEIQKFTSKKKIKNSFTAH